MNENTPRTRLLLTLEEAAECLRIGRSLMYELVARGRVRSIKIGRCRRIAMIDLEDFVAQQRDLATANAPAQTAPLRVSNNPG
jgi:excisionase family DNA binding protein